MLDIKETLAAFRNLKIMIIGDVMLDCYLHGKVERISPEAPVPIVTLKDRIFSPGGAANVALNICALRAKPVLISVIGKDTAGDELLNLLEEKQINTKYIFRSSARRTTSKSRVLAQHQQMLRFDEEDTFDLNKKEENQLMEWIKNELENSDIDAILFQDYNKGALTETLIRKILLEAVKRDIPTVVDPKNKNFYAYKRATLFKPNLKEINANLPFHSEANLEELIRAANFLTDKICNPLTLITLSEKGVFYSNQTTQKILPTIPRTIADVCGAGDSVISVAALGCALNLPLNDIALLANLAGGQVCESVGVVPVDVEKLELDYLNYIN